MFYSFRNISAATVNPKWASFSDLLKMAHLLVLVTGLVSYTGAFELLVRRLIQIGKKSGKKFLVLYLKECMRLTLAFLNHSIIQPQKGGIEVACGKSGLPLVLPGVLRKILWIFRSTGTIQSTLVTRAVLSVFRFYSVLQYKALPDLSTITGPFTGIGASFATTELRTVLRLFRLPKHLPRLTWSVTEAAGPNGPKATWFSGADAIALMFHPKIWFGLMCFGFVSGRYLLIAWLLVIQILSLPILPFILLLHIEIPRTLGRLVCLSEGGGKRRIIAITDWWTQMAFRPLHDYLFSILKKIPQDGTFDQWKPVEDWVLPRLRLGAPCFSFDLSSATDRLPILFQKDILTLVFTPWLAYLWVLILSRDWMFDGQKIRYSVGQPMGAYSSWGMLAFCHHVLVQLAALRAGWVGWFPYYAIVGDDIVIADAQVATQYQSILRHLGVSISVAKSLHSETGILEFAKRHASASRGELSGVSPSLLLAALRTPHMLAVLAVHLFDRSWLNFPVHLKCIGEAAFRILRIPRRLLALMFATIIGPSGLLRNGFHVTAFAEQWFTAISKLSMASAVPFIILGFKTLVEEDIADIAGKAEENFRLFASTWWRRRLFRGTSLVAGIISIPLILVSPGFWIYFRAFYLALNAKYSASLNLAGLVDPSLAKVPGAVVFDVGELDNLATIDWSRRRKVRQQFQIMERLMKAVADQIRTEVQNQGSLALTVPDIVPRHVDLRPHVYRMILQKAGQRPMVDPWGPQSSEDFR